MHTLLFSREPSGNLLKYFSREPSGPLTVADLYVGQMLHSSNSTYSILEFIGEGCFGKVAKCQNVGTEETVAIKLLKHTEAIKEADKEVSMLEFLSHSLLDPVRTNLVQFYGRFEHQGLTCLAFEILDTNLFKAIKDRNGDPLSVQEIRPIAQQLLVALDALKSMNILHTDIKPDNIMFTNLKDQPLRVKLIDFGLAIPAADVQTGVRMQPCGYRAPEVTLGIEFNESIDVWGVGCTLAFLYLGQNLFPDRCIYQMMKRVVEVLGFPEEYLLWIGRYTHCFFTEASGFSWRLLTPEEFAEVTKMTPQPYNSPFDGLHSLDDLVNMHPRIRPGESEDRTAFVQLLKRLLTFDGTKRWTPSRALDHPFITLSHLNTVADSEDYLRISAELMSVCPD